MKLNPALRDFWRQRARYRVLYGGRASSKSHDAAGMAVYLSHKYKVRFLCVRQFQNKIEESVYTLLKDKIETFGLSNCFEVQEKSITSVTGSSFAFYGLARNTSEIKSFEGADVLWIEEGHALTKKQWEILEPTIRKEGSQVWLIFNPDLVTDFVYQNFVVNPMPNSIVRLINYTENPFLSNTMLEVIESAKQRNYEDYEHVYLGVPRMDDDSVVIKLSWIEAAIDAHIKLGFEPSGGKTIGFDVADDGGDTCANIYAHGCVAMWSDEWKAREDELLKSCKRTYHNALERGAQIRYDSIGVGAFAGSKFDEINEERGTSIIHMKFNAGGGVANPDSYYIHNAIEKIKNKDYFSNLKSQAWWTIADRFRNTFDAIHNGTKYDEDQLISISSDMPNLARLKIELSTPKRDFDNAGKVKVEGKKDLAKRDIPSPNLADAFIMAFVNIKRPRGFFDL